MIENDDELFALTRRDGILEVRMHTDGGPALYTNTANQHSVERWAEVWRRIGRDPDTEVLIVTGTGREWLSSLPRSEWSEADRQSLAERGPLWGSPDMVGSTYSNLLKSAEAMIFGIDVPTIGAINGPASSHYEFALFCDITICTEDTTFRDSHTSAGIPPGDGLGMALQELIGTKRAAYHLYTGDPIDAPTALAYGMVNEVVPRDRLLPRAWEIAEAIMRIPRLSRRMTKQIVRRPWQRRYTDDAAFHFAHEQMGLIMDGPSTGISAGFGSNEPPAGAR